MVCKIGCVLSDNLISVSPSSQFSEAGHLASLDCLEELHLKGNQIFHSHTYRTHVFSYLHKTAGQVSLSPCLAALERAPPLIINSSGRKCLLSGAATSWQLSH